MRLHRQVTRALADVATTAIDPPAFTVGDEFQGSYPTVGAAIDAALWVRLALVPDVDVRFGIGWGEVTVLDPDTGIQTAPAGGRPEKPSNGSPAPSNSPAWPTSAPPTAAPTPKVSDPDAVNAALLCRDHLLGSMDARSLRLLRGLLEHKTKKDLAEMEGISASACPNGRHETDSTSWSWPAGSCGHLMSGVAVFLIAVGCADIVRRLTTRAGLAVLAGPLIAVGNRRAVRLWHLGDLVLVVFAAVAAAAWGAGLHPRRARRRPLADLAAGAVSGRPLWADPVVRVGLSGGGPAAAWSAGLRCRDCTPWIPAASSWSSVWCCCSWSRETNWCACCSGRSVRSKPAGQPQASDRLKGGRCLVLWSGCSSWPEPRRSARRGDRGRGCQEHHPVPRDQRPEGP